MEYRFRVASPEKRFPSELAGNKNIKYFKMPWYEFGVFSTLILLLLLKIYCF